MNHRPGRLRRLFWFTTGADSALLSSPDCPESERMKFSAIGGAMLMTTGLGLISGEMAFYQIFYPGMNEFEFLGTPWRLSTSFVFAVLWTLALYNMQRFLIFGARRGTLAVRLGLRDFLHMLPGVIFSSLIGLTVATPLQVFVFGAEVNAQLVLERQDRLALAFDAIERRFEDQTRRLLASGAPAGMSAGHAALAAAGIDDAACGGGSMWGDTGEDADTAALQRCLQLYTRAGDALAAAAPGTASLAREAALHAARIEKDKMEVMLATLQEPGLLKRAGLAYTVDPVFSWVLLLAVIFIQALPVLVRAMSPRGPYDDLVDIAGREKLAQDGIEPAVVYLFPERGGALAVDRFHKARSAEQAMLAVFHAEHRRLRALRMESFRRRFDELKHKHGWSDSAGV
jgi:hypothetical protein